MMVVFETRHRLAISRKVKPSTRSSRIFVTETETRGRPSRFPFARALRKPALTRSTMIERSSSATAPSTVNTILPMGVDVSTCSERLTNSMPRALNVSRARSRCDTDLAKRSNFQTTTASNRRRWPSSTSRTRYWLKTEHQVSR